MGQTHIQTRVPDELDEEVTMYQEDGDFMNRSEAIRSLLRAGLDAEGARRAGDNDQDDEDDDGDRLIAAGQIGTDITNTVLVVALASVLGYAIQVGAGGVVVAAAFAATGGFLGSFMGVRR